MKWLEGIKDKGLVLDVKNKKMSENQWLIFLFFISLSRGTILATLPTPSSNPKSTEAALLNYLFTGYNANARPTKSASDPVNLKFDIALRQLLDFNERKQIMTSSVWIRHYWNDPLLCWNSSQWDDITYLAVEPSLMWRPDITLYNNAEREFQGFDDFGKTRINIYSNGEVVWLIPIILISQCKMDLRFFPFDSQSCPLIFGSWAYDGGSLDFINRNPNGDLSIFSESGEFIVDTLKATRISKLYACCPNPYYTIEYIVHVTRKVKFYLFNLVIPGVLIALLSCFSFCLPPLSGERTGLIITNFLSISVYILMVSDAVPPSSNVPLLVKFYTALTAEIGCALVLNCIIIPLAARDMPMPRVMRLFFLEKLGYVFLCRRKKKVFKRKYNKGTNLQTSNSFINDDIFFERKVNGYANGGYANGHALNNNVSNNNSNHINSKNGSGGSEDMQLRERIKTIVTKENNDVSKKIQNIIDMMNDDLETKQDNKDWEDLTIVLDRMFFILFIITIILTVTILINQAPEITL